MRTACGTAATVVEGVDRVPVIAKNIITELSFLVAWNSPEVNCEFVGLPMMRSTGCGPHHR